MISICLLISLHEIKYHFDVAQHLLYQAWSSGATGSVIQRVIVRRDCCGAHLITIVTAQFRVRQELLDKQT